MSNEVYSPDTTVPGVEYVESLMREVADGDITAIQAVERARVHHLGDNISYNDLVATFAIGAAAIRALDFDRAAPVVNLIAASRPQAQS